MGEFEDTRTTRQRTSNLLSGQEHKVKVEGEVMQSDARLLRKDGRCDSGGDAPERRKQWKVREHQ